MTIAKILCCLPNPAATRLNYYKFWNFQWKFWWPMLNKMTHKIIWYILRAVKQRGHSPKTNECCQMREHTTVPKRSREAINRWGQYNWEDSKRQPIVKIEIVLNECGLHRYIDLKGSVLLTTIARLTHIRCMCVVQVAHLLPTSHVSIPNNCISSFYDRFRHLASALRPLN